MPGKRKTRKKTLKVNPPRADPQSILSCLLSSSSKLMPSACEVGGFNIDLWAEPEQIRTDTWIRLACAVDRGLAYYAIRVEQWMGFLNGKKGHASWTEPLIQLNKKRRKKKKKQRTKKTHPLLKKKEKEGGKKPFRTIDTDIAYRLDFLNDHVRWFSEEACL